VTPRTPLNESLLRFDKEWSLDIVTQISWLFVLERAWKALIAILIGVTVFHLSFGTKELWFPTDPVTSMIATFLKIGVVIGLAHTLYWELFRRSITVIIKGYYLHVSRGLFRREESSIFLQPHTVFFIRRVSVFELLFNLCTLEIFHTTNPNPDMVIIPSLPTKKAHLLKSFLTQQIDRQLGISLDEDHVINRR
jgi:hypothetical protein